MNSLPASRIASSLATVLVLSSLWASSLQTLGALPSVFGDLNNDGIVDVRDLVLLIDHVNRVSLFAQANLPAADLDDDGSITSAEVGALANALLGLPVVLTPKLVTIEPSSGSSEVGVTVRP